MMLLDIAREEVYIKNKVCEAMHKRMEQAAKHSAAMVESMNNVNSGIKDCLAMLTNAISNMYPQQMIPPKQWGNTQHYGNQNYQMSFVYPSQLPFNPSTQLWTRYKHT